MRYSLFPDDPRLALEVVNAISELQYRNILNGQGDRFADWGGISGPIQYAIDKNLSPKAALCTVLDTNVVLISGAGNPQQFVNLFLGATSQDVFNTPFNASPAVWDAVNFLWAKWNIGNVSNAQKWLFCGFSFGGAIAATMTARWLSLTGLAGIADCLSIAAPRPGLAALQQACGNLGIRWMNAADAVPYFPPHGEELQGAEGIYTLSQNRLWNQFVHPFQGRSMDTKGNVTNRPLPLPSSSTAALRLLQWLTSSNAQQAAQHSIGTYQAILSVVVSNSPQPADTSTPAIVVNAPFKGVKLVGPDIASSTWVPPPLPTGSVKIAVVPGTNPVMDVQGLRPIPSVGGVPNVSAYIPPAYRWKSVKIASGQYQVQWMNFGLTKPGTKSNTRAIAKWGNKMLRTLGTAPGVVQSGVSQAFAAFLAVATNSTLGFNPPWNVL